MPIPPEVVAAIVTSLASLGSSAIGSKKTDSPNDMASILDWTYTGKGHSDRPGYNEGGKAYRYMSSHFQKPPDSISEDQKVYDDDGRILGWFMQDGPAKSGFGAKGFKTKRNARQWAKTHPFQMNRGTEGEMWLGQRENLFRQDLDFSKREAANQFSIRKSQLDDELLMDRKRSRWDYSTMNFLRGEDQADTQVLRQREWQFQKNNAALEGDAFRSRMAAQYPGASTWDLLSGGSASGAGPGAVPGIPGMPNPSMGTQRSGPDPSVVAAKLNANSQAMQTISSAKIAQAQMQTQENIARRNALIEFMNTAIAGAKTPSEIMARAAAARLAGKQAESEDWRPGLLHEQAGEAASGAALKDAQRAKALIDAKNARTGSFINHLKNNTSDLSNYLGSAFPDLSNQISSMFRSSSIR